jgi:hypothetical protein
VPFLIKKVWRQEQVGKLTLLGLIDQLKIFANDKKKSIMQSPEEILKLLIAEKELDKQVYTMEKFKPVISKIIKDLSLDKADSKK